MLAAGDPRGRPAESSRSGRDFGELRATPWRVYEPPRFGRAALHRHLHELRRSRALLQILVRRELKARYKGSVLGFGWTLLNPLLLLAVYSLVFGIYVRIPLENYPLYLLSGLLPWLWVSQTLSNGSTCLVEGGMFVSKVMLPPQLLPVTAVLANGANFLLALPVLVVAAIGLQGLAPGPLLALPLVVVLQATFLAGLAVPLAAVCVLYRDVKFLVTNVLTFWFFMTPIVYIPEIVPEAYRPLLKLNPFFPFARAYQKVFYEQAWPSLLAFGAMAAVSIVAVVAGVLVFERVREPAVEEL